ncbi:MAG: CoA-binding protein [Candidatus Moranbacteria bacterium]|nr:CoA-binding protein [Candidatus Moranbacteria bacterium]
MQKTKQKAGIDSIKAFLSQEHIGIVGVSRKPSKFGNTIFKELKMKQYKLYPVHSSLETFDGETCYKTILALPSEVTAIILCTQPEQSFTLVKDAYEKNILHIWLQQGAQTNEALQFAQENKINLIHRECVLMFAEPAAFIHRFHGSINKLFGLYPK